MRGLLMLRALGDYGGLMVFPAKLHIQRTILYPASTAPGAQWSDLLVGDHLALAGIAILAAFILGASAKVVVRSARIFGAAWFVLTYLPTSNLFDMNAPVAEHWLYLPSVGVLIFIGGCVSELPARWSRVAAAAGCVAIVLFSALNAVRSSDWVDPETFFRRTFAAGGASSRIGVNLAVIYAKRGEHARAEEILRKVLQVSPNYPIARSNLALALTQQGKNDESAAVLGLAHPMVSAQPTGYRPTYDAALGLARLRRGEKNDSAALELVDTALHDYPDTWELISLRAQIVRDRGGSDAAIATVQDYVHEHWWHFSAAVVLAKLHAQAGDLATAAREFHRASRLDIHDAGSLNAAARLEAAQNNLDAACRTQRRAVARHPDQPRQYLLLAQLLQKMGRTAEGEKTLATAARLYALAQSQVAAN